MRKVYINARFLTQKLTGVQRFAVEISKQLKTSELGGEICFIAPKNIIHKELAEELEVKIIGYNKGHLWEQLDLVKFLRSKGNPTLLNLANSAPLLYKNNIVTIHDLSVFYNPNWFSLPYRTFYSFLTPKIVLKSKAVFTVSNTIEKELVERFNLGSNKVTVIYNAVSEQFKNHSASVRKEENFILTVCSIDPRKNLKNLILGFMDAQLSKEYELLVIGGENAAFAKTDLHEVIKNDSRIKLLGRVTDEELLNLYSKAKFFAYTSFYEGFGLPNIEAMAMGTPVLTSDIPVLKEICGEGAYYVNPYEISDISAGIQKLINTPNLLESLSERGYKICSKYSWSISAAKICKVLNQQLNR